MGDVVRFAPNKLGYAHVICGDCQGNSWHVACEGDRFKWLVCASCNCHVPVDMSPVFSPKEDKDA